MSAPAPALTPDQARTLLGLSPNAGSGEVLNAFRTAAKLAHPDRPGGDAARFREVVNAYRVLMSTPRLPAILAKPAPAPCGGVVEIAPLVAVEGGEAEARLDDGRRLRVRLSPGARDGETLRVGEADRVIVRLVSDEAVQVRGSDIWITAPVAPFMLAEGGRAAVETPLGRKVVWITRAAAARRLIRLDGQGLPARGAHGAGSLFVRLEPEAGAQESPARAQLKKFAAAWAA